MGIVKLSTPNSNVLREGDLKLKAILINAL